MRRTNAVAGTLPFPSVRFGRVVLAIAVASGVVVADQILETYSASLTSYLAAKSRVQDTKPRPEQRGVNLDGSMRKGSTHALNIAGNPFEKAWRGTPEIGGVRLDTGVWSPTAVDIALPAKVAWVIGRSFNDRQDHSGQYDSASPQGVNWFQTSQPEIVLYDDADNTKDVLYLVYGADRYAEYNRTGSSSVYYKGKNGATGIFQYVSGSPDTWVLTDANGMIFTFFGWNTSSNRADGQLWTVVDPDGNKAYVGDPSSASNATGTGSATKGWDNSGHLLKAVDSAGRRFSYTYNADSPPHLSQVLVETKTGGSWETTPTGTATVATVDYTYYGNESYGDAGDLKTVTVTTPLSDSGINDVRVSYLRYWEGSYNSSTNPGYPHEIQLVLEPEGTRRYDYAGDSTFDSDFATESTANLKSYSAAYLEYDSSRRVNLAFFNGQCGCSGSGDGEFTLRYETNGSYTDNSGYDTAWCKRTSVSRPDGTWLTQYFDEDGQALSSIVSASDPSSGPPTSWPTEVTRDSMGCVTYVITPEAVATYTHNSGGVPSGTFSDDTDGLVHRYVRLSSTDVKGFVGDAFWRKGSGGTEYYDRSYVWWTNKTTQTFGGITFVRPLLKEDWDYPTATTTQYHSSAGKTAYAYTAYGGAQTLSVEVSDVTPPVVATGNNGNNTAHIFRTHYTKDGEVDFKVQTDGTYRHTKYQARSTTLGKVTESRDDADTTSLSPPTNFDATGTGIINDITSDDYDAQGRTSTKTLPGGRVTKTYYSVLKDKRLVTLDFPKYVSGSSTYYGPVQYRVTNQAGKVEAQGVIAVDAAGSTAATTTFVDETDGDPITAIDTDTTPPYAFGQVAQLHTYQYDNAGTQLQSERVYFVVPASGAGSDGTNYDQTTFGYDDFGRKRRVKETTGTITRTVYDSRGNVTERWIGTNDYSFAGGEVSGPDNMVKVEATTFDTNGYVTARTAYIQDSSTGQRVTSYSNDIFGRALLVTNPTAPHVFNKYDNEGRLVASGQFSSTGSIVVGTDDPTTETANRLALSQTFYDERGRVWKTQRHQIDASDGSDDDNLQTLTWYDELGRKVKVDGEQLEKWSYDRLDRVTNDFLLAKVDSTEEGSPTVANASTVASDLVLEERQTVYDSGGNVVLSASIARLYDDLANETTGALDTNADGGTPSVLKLTYADLAGRAQISAMWYDSLDRLIDRVEYGNNGGSTFDRNGLSTPSRSDTELRTTYEYNTDGTLYQMTDPKGIINRNEYDALGRKTKTIANYVNGSPSANGDDDQTVIYAYTDGLQTSITADLSGTDQVTTYTFGTTKGTNPGDSKIATGHLLKKVQYPDSSSSTWDIVAFAYNAQGQETWKRDQARDVSNQSDYNIIETTYDDSGRQTSRAVTQLRAACDNAVLRIETAYDALGRTSTVTQYDAASSGSVVDQVKYLYDGWGDITNFQQDRDSAVGTGTYREVAYTYSKATGGRNTVRRATETLPSGATYTFSYSSSGNLLDDVASRVTSIKNNVPTTLVTYDYNGAGQVVGTTLNVPGVWWKLYGSSSFAFDDLDRFNRVTTSKWTKDLSTDRDIYHVNLTYDRNSNIATADDTVHTGHDVKYTNDSLNRLTEAQEGTLSAGSITSQSRDEQWTLSQTGNWDRNKLNLNSDGDFTDAGELDDTRVHNDVNEISTRDTDSNASVNYTLVYDAAGNLTDDNQSYKYEWDAFGRLRRIKNQSSNLVAEYWYNGLGYMLSNKYDTDRDGDVDSNDKKFHFAYDERWRQVAKYRGTDTYAKEEFLYHCAGAGGYGGSSYIDLCLFRDRDGASGEAGLANASFDERLYYCQNWRADVVTLVDSSGVWDWLKYSAYGVPFGIPTGDADSDGDCDAADVTQVQTWINGSAYDVRGDVDLDGDVDATDKSSIQANYQGITEGRGAIAAYFNRKGYAGYTSDSSIPNIWHVRHRVLNSELGRWLSRDGLSSLRGLEFVQYVAGAPVRFADYLGLLQTSAGVGSTRSCPSPNQHCSWDIDIEASDLQSPPQYIGGNIGYFMQTVSWHMTVCPCGNGGGGPIEEPGSQPQGQHSGPCRILNQSFVEIWPVTGSQGSTSTITDDLDAFGFGTSRGASATVAAGSFFAAGTPGFDALNKLYNSVPDKYIGASPRAVTFVGRRLTLTPGTTSIVFSFAPSTGGDTGVAADTRTCRVDWRCCNDAYDSTQGFCDP